MNKITKTEFKALLERGRKYSEKARQISILLDDRIAESFPNIEADAMPTLAYNADNFQEAIKCYMQYGEYDVDSLWNELKNAIND